MDRLVYILLIYVSILFTYGLKLFIYKLILRVFASKIPS